MGLKKKNRLSNGIIYALLIIMTIIWLFPFFGILMHSLEVESRGLSGHLIPHQWGFDNYVALFKTTDFPKWFLNTFITGLATSVLQTLFTLLMSYTLSRLRFKGRKLLMNFMLILGMFPGFLSMILLYKVLSWCGLTGPHAVPGLILVYCASSGMGYYVSKVHLRSIKELQYGKADKRTETESEAQGKKATGDPQSAIADGTLVYCFRKTL